MVTNRDNQIELLISDTYSEATTTCSNCSNLVGGFDEEESAVNAYDAGFRVIDGYTLCPECRKLNNKSKLNKPMKKMSKMGKMPKKAVVVKKVMVKPAKKK